MKRKFAYNAPVTLTFSIICVLVTAATLLLPKSISEKLNVFFASPSCQGTATAFNWKNFLDYFRLFFYVFGHGSWNHLIANLSFILLLGPLMEERYGSPVLILMITVTAFVSGAINVCFLPTLMHGASGIVFMLILLSSLASITKSTIPLSFIFVLAIFLGREIITLSESKEIAVFAHVAGGLCGSMFGFLIAPKKKKTKKEPAISDSPETTDETTIVGELNL